MVQWKQIQCTCEIKIDKVLNIFCKTMHSLRRSKSPWQRYGPFHLGWDKQEEEKSNPIPHGKMIENVQMDQDLSINHVKTSVQK
jgi:hypothetical protein